VAALGPLVKEAHRPRRWLISAVAYTASGLVSGAMVGALLGAFGSLAIPGRLVAAGVVTVTGIVVISTDTSLVGNRLLFPRRRQTRGIWAHRFPYGVVAALWGFDLGLTFNARLTFAGPWLLAAAAVLSGSAPFGSILFASFWGGRSLSVWATPYLLEHANDAEGLGSRISSHFRLFQAVELTAVLVACMVMASQV